MDDTNVLSRALAQSLCKGMTLIAALVLSQPGSASTPEPVRLPPEYRALLTDAESLPELQRVAAVNRWVNERISFASDAELWGRLDYWATPHETAALNRGDCEDIALLKTYLLTRAGIAPERLKLVFITGGASSAWSHMVLVYRHHNGVRLVLDNLITGPQSTTGLAALRPAYSFGPRGAHHYRGTEPRRFRLNRVHAWRDFEARLSAAGQALWHDTAHNG